MRVPVKPTDVIRGLPIRILPRLVSLVLVFALWLICVSPAHAQALIKTMDFTTGTTQNLETYSKNGELRLAPTGTWGAQSWKTPDKVLNIGSAYTSDGTDLYVLRGNADVAFWRYKTATNSWETLANAPAGAYYGADLVYENGYVYAIFGGYQKTFARYSIAANTWELRQEFPSLIYRGGSLVSDGTYLYGTTGNNTQEFYRYNVTTNVWSPLAPTPSTLSQGADLSHVGGYLFTPRGVNSVTFYRYDIGAGTWSTRANITAALNGDMETTSDGTDVYLARQNNTNSVYKYDVSSNAWSTLANTPYVMANGGVQHVSSDNKIYFFRGSNDYRFWKYDISTNAFLGPADVPATIGYGTDLLAYGNELYMPRGNGTTTLYKYNSSTNIWTTLAAAPGALSNDSKGVVAGANIYLFSANNNTTFYRYDPGSNSWSTMAAAPAAARYGAALAYPGSGDYVYATRGNGTTAFWRYSLGSNTWDDAAVSDLPAGAVIHYGSRMVSDGSYVYATGGLGLKTMYRYEIATDTWTELANLPYAPYVGSDIAIRNGKIIALAGWYRPEMYEYTISTNAWRQLQSLDTYTPTELGTYNGASIELDTNTDTFYVIPGGTRSQMLVYNPGANDYVATGSWESETLDFQYVSSWGDLIATEETPGDSSITYQSRSSSDGTSWSSWQDVTLGQIDSPPQRYLQVRATLYAATGQTETPVVQKIQIGSNGDTTAPINPSTFTGLSQAVGGETLTSGTTYRYTHPYFSWNAATDAHSAVAGYYVYFGTNELANPVDLGAGSTFQTTLTYQSNEALSTGVYYLRIAVKDSAGNTSAPITAFEYVYGGVSPSASIAITSTLDFSGTPTGVQVVNDAVKLEGQDGGFWLEKRLATPPGAIQWGGINSVYLSQTNKVYILPAANNTLFWAYDLTTDTWETLASTPGTVSYGGGLVEGPEGYLYAARGNNTTDFWRYDIASNTWETNITSAPLTISYGSSMVYDGSGYLYITRGNNTDTFWRYDTGSDEWFGLAQMDFDAPSNNINNVVHRGAGLAIDRTSGLIYATQGNYRAGFSVYNINTNSWTVLPATPTLTYDGSSLAYVPDSNAVYFTGGNSTPYLYKYDAVDQVWTQLNDAPTTLLYGAGITRVDQKLYTFRGGNTNGFYLYDIEKDSWLIPTRGLFSRVFDGSSQITLNTGAGIVRGEGGNYYITRGNYSDDFVRWNENTGEIVRLANIPVGSYSGYSMVYDAEDKLIYATGSSFDHSYYSYSIEDNVWERISTDPPPAYFSTGASQVYDGTRYIYAARGGGTATFYRYDKDAAAGTRWTTLANAPATLSSGSELVLKDGKIYTLRGSNVANNPFYSYDISANTWSTLAPFPTAVNTDGFLADGNDGYLYATRATNTDTMYRYSVAGDAWTAVSSPPAQFSTGSSGESNGQNKIFATAGAGTNSYQDAIYTYVLQTDASGFGASGEYVSQIHNPGQVYKWANLTIQEEVAPNTTMTYATRSSDDGSTWSDWADVSQKKQVGDTSVFKINSPANAYVQLKASFASPDGISSPVLEGYTFNYYSDTTAPTNPQTAGLSAFSQTPSGSPIVSETWYSHTAPYFSWTEPEAANGATDTAVGSGVTGYYVYFGEDSNADPAVDGTLQEEEEFTAGGLTTGTTNYLRIKTVDAAGNVAATTWQPFIYKFDSSQPAAPATLSADPAGYTATDSFDFTWTAASASGSPVVAWCYKTNAVSGPYATEQCTPDADQLSVEDVPSYQVGTNVFQVRAKNQANTFSAPKTVNYYYADPSNAPSPPTNLHLTTPTTNTENSFGFAWDVPSAFLGSSTNLSYRFSVNALPTPQSTSATSLRYLNPGAYATLPGENVFYVVARDEAGNVDYSNYAQISFFANTVAPGIPVDVEIADVSVKNTAAWRLALSWEPPVASGSGVYNYAIYRSTNAETYTQISTTTSSSYVDTGLSQVMYYYKVKACDNTSNCGEFSSVVNLLPDGRFTDAATLTAGPTVSEITTRKAVVSWSTNRFSDSKIAYGTKEGEYFEEEVGSSEPVTSHVLTLNNLTPGTKYYFTAKWTDEDGNTGQSDESSFTTQPPPSTEEPVARNVGLSSAVIEFVTRNASKVKLYYGESSAFGGIKEIVTSTAESTQVVELSELKDATKYYYKINTLDVDGTEYEGEIHSFETLPRPTISNVIVQQINGTAKTTLLVRWSSNTAISSIVTYYPTGAPQSAIDEVNVALEAGAHQMILFNLEPQTDYSLLIRGQDVAGNEAVSSVQQITTSADTRPPQISELKAESEIIGTGEEATAQLIVSYKTDEPASSQVEYGEGTGSVYSQKSQQSTTPTNNHLVIISGLSPGRVYHMRAVSIDAADNQALSVDKVVVTPKATENALDLVVNNLVGIFSFMK